MPARWTAPLACLALLQAGCGGGAGPGGDAGGTTPEPGDAAAATLTRAEALQGEPLAAARTGEGPRFRKLEASETGVGFTNHLHPDNRYPYLTNGSGLAVGDIDGDGMPDLVFCGLDTPTRIYRQVDRFRFSDVTGSAGLPTENRKWAIGAALVDVDGDLDLDLYLCHIEAPNELWINDGRGSFAERGAEFGVDQGGATTMAAFSDYDLDGDLDLFLLNNRVWNQTMSKTLMMLAKLPPDTTATAEDLAVEVPSGNGWLPYVDKETRRIIVPEHLKDQVFAWEDRAWFCGQADRLLRNEGGRFVDVTEHAGISGQTMGLSASWWDYDRDGDPDLYVTSDLEWPDQLWQNQGNGTFRNVTEEAFPHVAYYGMGADFTDVNGDGLQDFLAADMAATTHFKSKWMMGEMGNSGPYLERARPQQYMRNPFFVNTGTGRFLEAGFLAGISKTDWTWTIRFGDLDLDGWPDLLATNGIGRHGTDPDIAAEFYRLMEADQRGEAMTLMRSVPALPEKNLAFRHDGDRLHFTNVAAEWGLDYEGVSNGAVLTDLDRDGDLDVVINNQETEAGIFENLSDPAAGGARMLLALRAAAEGNRHGLGAEVEARAGGRLWVQQLTSSRGYMAGIDPVLHFGFGSVERLDELIVRWPSGRVSRFADVATGMRYTITEDPGLPLDGAGVAMPEPVWTAVGDGFGVRTIHRERDFNDYASQPLLPHRQSEWGPGVALGDFDGDGRDDLWIGGGAGQPGQLWRAEGEGFAGPVRGPWAGHYAREDLGALWFDLEGDGDLDLYVVSGGTEAPVGGEEYRDRVYRNDGRDGFIDVSRQVLPDLSESGSGIAAADLDGDGDLDLCVTGRLQPGSWPSAPPTRLLRNDSGKLVDATEELAPGLMDGGVATSCVWADFDRDGDPDLMLAAHWRPLRVFRNDGGRLAEVGAASGLQGDPGWWNSLATLDVDGDGDLDVLAGNFGRNHKYGKTDRQHPTGLRVRDFDDDGRLEIVETKQSDEGLLPVRGLSCSSNAMPHLRQKFTTYKAYASSGLSDIYGDDELQQAMRLEVTRLESVLLRNEGGLRFTMEPLPWMAQIAPVFGIAVGDMDGDGDPDAWLGQNFLGPEPETGDMAGGVGQWLRNDGGELVALAPGEAGAVSPHATTAAALLDADGDGRPELLAAKNRRAIDFFATRAEATWLALRFAGPAGNPTGVGALVTVEVPDLPVQTATVHAGGGYLTGTPGTLWFGGGDGEAEVAVRWPDGGITSHKVAAEGVHSLARERQD